MHVLFRRGLATALPLLLLGAPIAASAAATGRAVATPAPRAHPGLWVVRKGATTIWLFGTIHALPEGYGWRAPAIDRVIAQADELIVETKLDPDPAKSAALFYRMAGDHAAGLPPLAERLPASDRPALVRMEKRLPMPPATLDTLETWAAGMLLVGASLDNLGISGAAGVEEKLKAEFAAAGKPIGMLETPAQQLGLFDTLPEAEQRAFLKSVVATPEEDRRDFDKMLAAWSRGDEQGIVASFDKDFKASPVLREVLVARRNAAWADMIARRLAKPGKLLIAVGAGHLAGPLSVQQLLEKKGIRVERVE